MNTLIPMANQAHVDGEAHERVTEAWRLAVRAWMAQESRSQAFLARQVGCDPALISLLLNGAQSSSVYARRISEITGVPLPTVEVDDDERRLLRLVRAARRKNPAHLRAIEGLARVLSESDD